MNKIHSNTFIHFVDHKFSDLALKCFSFKIVIVANEMFGNLMQVQIVGFWWQVWGLF